MHAECQPNDGEIICVVHLEFLSVRFLPSRASRTQELQTFERSAHPSTHRSCRSLSSHVAPWYFHLPGTRRWRRPDPVGTRRTRGTRTGAEKAAPRASPGSPRTQPTTSVVYGILLDPTPPQAAANFIEPDDVILFHTMSYYHTMAVTSNKLSVVEISTLSP